MFYFSSFLGGAELVRKGAFLGAKRTFEACRSVHFAPIPPVPNVRKGGGFAAVTFTPAPPRQFGCFLLLSVRLFFLNMASLPRRLPALRRKPVCAALVARWSCLAGVLCVNGVVDARPPACDAGRGGVSRTDSQRLIKSVFGEINTDFVRTFAAQSTSLLAFPPTAEEAHGVKKHAPT